MRGQQQRLGWWFSAVFVLWFLPANVAWGYFFDDRREMSLSGLAYSRGTMALANDRIGTHKGYYQIGNIVSHRSFLTLEWRHNIGRLTRSAPTVGPLFEFLNFDSFDYFLNVREEYEGAWDYGPQRIQRQLDGGGGTSFWNKYFGRQQPKYPGEFFRFNNFENLTSINYMEKKVNQLRLFEWYLNITKGPLFIRFGRQNLSWGETDGFRLLDQINPLDNLFGGSLVSLDERRIPLNMLRAQWSFGTIGPITDLTLEGFVSIDRRTAAQYTLNQGSFWNTPTNTSPVQVYRQACGGPLFGRKNVGPNDSETPGGLGTPCSVRAQGPHDRLADARGGGRITGTIHDFTFSIAHYYTWQDQATSEAGVLSPSAAHLAWDLGGATFTRLTGKPATKENNPWGANDPVVGAGGVTGGPGGSGTPAGGERNVWVPIREKRIQISGATLSFPVNALTGMFVGSDNPLYYLYTTFRSEAAYFRNVGLRSAFHDGDATTAFQRFLTLPLHQAGVRPADGNAFYNPQFLPGGRFSSEGNCTDSSGERGCRRGRMKSRDVWAFNVGLDHNQWILWINKQASIAFSVQLFKFHVMNNHRDFSSDTPAGLLNDVFATGVRPRFAAPTGPTTNRDKLLRAPLINAPGVPTPTVQGGNTGNRGQQCITRVGADGKRRTHPPCEYRGLLPVPNDQEITTFSASTTYMGGNLRPSFVMQYDWAGAWLMQPSMTWTFWDPFRVNVTYNWIEGRWTGGLAGGIGWLKAKDNIWIELQYQLY